MSEIRCSKCHQVCEKTVQGPDGTPECGMCNAISRSEPHYELSAIFNYLNKLQEIPEGPKKLFEMTEKRGPGRPKKG